MAQPQWFVSVFGSENELTAMRNFLDSPNCYLEQLDNKICYLTSCRFSNLEGAKEVCDRAKKLLTMIKAFAKLELVGDYQSVHIGKGKITVYTENVASIIQRVDGSQSAWVYPPTVGVTVTVLPVRVSGAELVEPPKREKRLHDDYLNRCDKVNDDNIFDALFYFAQETSWYTLYNAYETVKLVLDGHLHKKKHGKKKPSKILGDYEWATPTELHNFTYTANHYGTDGRHSRIWGVKGEDTFSGSIITIAQGEELVRRLMTNWLELESLKHA